MKRLLLIALAGLVAGAFAHIGFYAYRRPAVDAEAARDLAWMREYFALDEGQYARIRALHDRTGPELQRLFVVLKNTRNELERLEELRRNTDRVDFITYHQTAEQNRQARQQCRNLTLELVYAVAEVMSPEQRTRYFTLIGKGVEFPGTTPKHG